MVENDQKRRAYLQAYGDFQRGAAPGRRIRRKVLPRKRQEEAATDALLTQIASIGGMMGGNFLLPGYGAYLGGALVPPAYQYVARKLRGD